MNFIIDFKDSATLAQRTSYLTKNKCTIITEYDNFAQTYLVSCQRAPAKTSIVESIHNDDDNEITLLGDLVTVNRYYGRYNPDLPETTIDTKDEKDWWKNFVLAKPSFDAETIQLSRKGANVNVYILDSGIKADHPEFEKANITELYSVIDNFEDTNGHGTALASVISGGTCGLTEAKLKIVKIFHDGYSTKQSEIITALDRIMSDFLENPHQAAVLNCSWSIPKNPYIEQKLRTLIETGVYLVVSSGNNGVAITDVTPASMPEALTIGSYNADLAPSDFTNFTGTSAISNTEAPTNSGKLSGWAPGENIYVATLDGAYGMVSGTSIAAAIHSCVLAYNFSDHLVEGQLLGFHQKQTTAILSKLSLNRTDILDLSDEKYAESENRISTLVNEVSFESYVLQPFLNFSVRIGSVGSRLVFNPQDVESAELMSPLPPDFKITETGLLIGEPKSVEGDFAITKVVLRLTMVNGDLIDKEMTIAVLSETFDRDLVAPDDPIVALTLDAPLCSSTYTGNLTCQDNCRQIDFSSYCGSTYMGKIGRYCECI
jgi:subtilisin family serine protease